MESLVGLLAEHEFFRGLNTEYLDLATLCAKNERFESDSFIFREGQDADVFYLIRHGRVAIEIAAPDRGAIVIQTIGPGEVLGWSWLVPPYRWHFDARALDPVRALALDGACLRGKCEEDTTLGYELMKRFAKIILSRLEGATVQLLDIYGHAATR